MKRNELVIGQVYWANHAGSKVKVRLLGIQPQNVGYRRLTYRYDCLKISTGRTITFRSAMKFIGLTDVPCNCTGICMSASHLRKDGTSKLK